MTKYEKRILGYLLDSYENSLLFSGKNKIGIKISFPFTTGKIPEYFDESSLEYETIHEILKQMESKRYIKIVWKRKGNIVSKVLLDEERIMTVYKFLGRKPKAIKLTQTLDLLHGFQSVELSEICSKFIAYLIAKLKENKSVSEYIKIDDLEQTRLIIRALVLMEMNTEECYIREFSIRHFGNSKTYEEVLPVLVKIMRRFETEYEEMETPAILSEYFIYSTPNYVYIKGDAGLLKLDNTIVSLRGLEQGIGISGDDIEKINFGDVKEVKKVITIENLTTFFRWKESGSIIIYLGGYHNSVRRKLLAIIYESIPEAEYLHFGDIDAGGFEVYEDLCKKTGIPFKPYYMDVQTLQNLKSYAKRLTDNDRKRIKRLMEIYPAHEEVMDYMLGENVKLEQECVIALIKCD